MALILGIKVSLPHARVLSPPCTLCARFASWGQHGRLSPPRKRKDIGTWEYTCQNCRTRPCFELRLTTTGITWARVTLALSSPHTPQRPYQLKTLKSVRTSLSDLKLTSKPSSIFKLAVPFPYTTSIILHRHHQGASFPPLPKVSCFSGSKV